MKRALLVGLQVLGALALWASTMWLYAGGAAMDDQARPPPGFVEWHQMAGAHARDAGMP